MKETEVKLGLLKQFYFLKFDETYPGFIVKKVIFWFLWYTVYMVV